MKYRTRNTAEQARKSKMAAKSRSFLRAKRFLDRQAAGGKNGQFAVQRTIEHLKKCNVVLNEDVKEVKINFAGPEEQNSGAQRFFNENLPQLKFKNPHVQFSSSRKISKAAALLVKFGDGKYQKVITTEKDPSQIMEEFINIANMSTTSSNENQDADT